MIKIISAALLATTSLTARAQWSNDPGALITHTPIRAEAPYTDNYAAVPVVLCEQDLAALTILHNVGEGTKLSQLVSYSYNGESYAQSKFNVLYAGGAPILHVGGPGEAAVVRSASSLQLKLTTYPPQKKPQTVIFNFPVSGVTAAFNNACKNQ